MTNLYSKHAKEFSDTRQSPWKGWDILINKINIGEGLNILDLGCGNGRFLKYLLNNNIKVNNYLGVDSSEELLQIASSEFTEKKENIEFLRIDLEDPQWIQELFSYNLEHVGFNLVTAFGLVHHLHTFNQRKNIYKYSYELLKTEGLFCVTFWQFLQRQKLKAKGKRLNSENDYELAFGNHGATRFVHYTDEKEITKFENEVNFNLLDEYYSDGKEGNLNLYKIYQK